MSPRATGWTLGFLGGVLLAAALPEELFPGVRPVALIGTLLTAGLLGEWDSGRRTRRVRWTPRDARPPDGRVDVAMLPSVLRRANTVDPRFGEFIAFESAGPAAAASPARPMLGRVVLVSLFVGHDGRAWDDINIARVHEALERAGRWFEREAQRWGVALNVELADTYFGAGAAGDDEVVVGHHFEGDELVTMEEHAEPKALAAATRVAVRHGFRDAEHLVRTVEARLGADSAVWLLHPLRAGGSLALPPDRRSLLWGVNLAICYAREATFPEPLRGPARTDPVSVVHEVLHLFGATDKYGRSLDEFEPATVTSREVMRLDETRLGRVRIDARTAREIGWGDDPKPTAAANR